MSISRSIFTLAVLVSLLAAGAIGAARAATLPTPLAALVGNWSCTYTGPKGSATSTYEIVKSNDLWISGTGDNGAYGKNPPSKTVFVWGYDTKKHLYLSMGGDTNPGDYGTSTATGPANATTLTFTNAWPADPTAEKDLWHFGNGKITVSSTWTEKGKTMTSKSVCSKT
ncbi:MAG TPA: hypothetical protein VMA98_11400 [Candidatus Acidoferrales bacterium]|nr:hypothetical protein [Candidatus Acidoferrales bacterium]